MRLSLTGAMSMAFAFSLGIFEFAEFESFSGNFCTWPDVDASDFELFVDDFGLACRGLGMGHHEKHPADMRGKAKRDQARRCLQVAGSHDLVKAVRRPR